MLLNLCPFKKKKSKMIVYMFLQIDIIAHKYIDNYELSIQYNLQHFLGEKKKEDKYVYRPKLNKIFNIILYCIILLN